MVFHETDSTGRHDCCKSFLIRRTALLSGLLPCGRLIPKRLSYRLILALTVLIVGAESITCYLNLRTQEDQLLVAMVTGADQLSRAITSATWHAMLADHREAAYQTMQTIAGQRGSTASASIIKRGG